eukprot:TRINITY_DN35751_c0_g1_i1.p1 TRINITY_DN35751_c0_g1~~TRINITY_DN35751_c0_g1_i1.p1  ORF type:complete len:681 (+),score=118.59 TRINITY_DN35751_c0_g1_i1:296-2338(+)
MASRATLRLGRLLVSPAQAWGLSFRLEAAAVAGHVSIVQDVSLQPKASGYFSDCARHNLHTHGSTRHISSLQMLSDPESFQGLGIGIIGDALPFSCSRDTLSAHQRRLYSSKAEQSQTETLEDLQSVSIKTADQARSVEEGASESGPGLESTRSLNTDGGDDELSAEILEKLVESAEGSFGVEHHFTATTQLKLAQAYQREGITDPAKIRSVAEKAWKWFSVHVEPNSLVRAMCLHLLAACSTRLGQPEEALQLLDQALAVPVESQGPDHAMMLFTTHLMMGDTWVLMSGHQEAKEAYSNAFTIQERTLGPDSEHIADTCRHVAEAHVHMMLFDEAEPYALRALRLHQNNGGEGSLVEAHDRRLLAGIYGGLDQPEEALVHLEIASEILSQSGRDLEAALTDVAIGDMRIAAGRPEAAVGVFEGAVKVLKEQLGERHQAVAAAYVSIAEAAWLGDNKAAAKRFCRDALEIYDGMATEDDPLDIANGMSELARVYELMGHLEMAASLLRRALSLRKSVPGQLVMEAGTQMSLGTIGVNLGRYAAALADLDECQANLEVALGVAHPSLAQVLQLKAQAIGKAEGLLGSDGDALSHLQRARELLEKAEMGDTLESADVDVELAKLLNKLGRDSEAVQAAHRAQKIRTTHLPLQHSAVQETNLLIESLLPAQQPPAVLKGRKKK